MPKICSFLPSILQGFGLDLAGSWASKMEPSWPFWLTKTVASAYFYLLKINFFKKWRLGGLQARFWRPRASILEGLGSIFPRFSVKKTINVKNLPRKDIDHRFARPPRVGGRRWSPPGGVQLNEYDINKNKRGSPCNLHRWSPRCWRQSWVVSGKSKCHFKLNDRKTLELQT